MNRRILYPGFGILLLLVAGCVSIGDRTPEEITIPGPQSEARFFYEGDRGSTLTLNVSEVEERADNHLRTHQVINLSIVYRAADEIPVYGHGPYTFEEAVDTASGLIVHEVGHCARPLHQDAGCRDNRSAVLFGNTGLPGAFGLAPLWEETITPGEDITVSIEPDGSDPVAYQNQGPPEASDYEACAILEIPTHDKATTRLPYHIDEVPIIVCDDLPLPARFTTHTNETFTLTHTTPGSNPIPLKANHSWNAGKSVVPFRPTKPPLVAQDETDPGPLTVERAHREAQAQQEAYESFFEENPSAVVVESDVRRTFATSTAGLVETIAYERRLLAMASSGDAVEVTVTEERVQDHPTGHEVSEPTRHEIDHPPHVDRLPSQLSQIGPAVELAEQLTQLPQNEGSSLGLWWSSAPHDYTVPRHSETPHNPFILVMHEEPGQRDTGGGLMIIKPGYTVLDAGTGELVLFEREAKHLPFDGRLVR